MRALLAPLIVLGGCSSVFGLDDPVRDVDASVDSAIDATGPFCLGEAPFDICVPSRPAAPVSLVGIIDTGVDCDFVDSAHGQPLCVRVGATVTIGDVLVRGPRPFVVLAADIVDVQGELDAASRAGNVRGPGANASTCAVGTRPDNSNNGAGGGAGGGFGSSGGQGGAGENGAVRGGERGMVEGYPTSLRGGCPGQPGGAGTAMVSEGGSGGGAVYIVAGIRIEITGTINASGAGGGGGMASKGGGGGGGSGGMIALAAPTIEFTGVLIANGGGGGGGADGGAGGKAGAEPTSVDLPATGGLGGGATTCGATPGCGGFGAHLHQSASNGSTDATGAGGGGGGGGVGYVLVLSGQPLTGKISPAL
jgi:hypothetical protein